MLSPLLLLLASAAVIYLSCEYFVNAVEWAGIRLGVSRNAVGTVLAAFGTALPESVVTFVAVVFGKDAGAREIGVGAAMGGPLVLATIAYAVVGGVHLLQRPRASRLPLDAITAHRLQRDQIWFMAIFVCKVALGLVAFAWKPWLGVVFLLAYGVYVVREMRRTTTIPTHAEKVAGAAVDEDDLALAPLKFQPHAAEPATGWVMLQTGMALVVIFLSSQFFVHQLDALGPLLHLSPQLVALLLSPVATELPEILNAVIWVRQGKFRLALGNISGAMMIQATIPSALGLLFTPWLLSPPLLWAGVVTMLSIIGLIWLMRRISGPARGDGLSAAMLSLFGLFYIMFAIGLIWL